MKLKLVNTTLNKIFPALALLTMILFPNQGFTQAEFTTWGNMTGIRVENQLMKFTTSLAIVNQNDYTRRTRKEGQDIDFKRDGARKVFSYKMNDLNWEKSIETLDMGEARVEVSFSSSRDTIINAAFFSIELPEQFDTKTTFKLINPESISLQDISANFPDAQYKAPALGILIEAPGRRLEVNFSKPTEVIIYKASEDSKIRVNMIMASGEIEGEEIFNNNFTIKASGEMDKSPLSLQIFPKQQGKVWDGIGGNFRLQNAKTDPQVIDYSLENLNVTWSRVEMPWREWHPDQIKDPASEARNGNLHPKVKAAMEMAQRLDKMGIPVMLAGWFAPEWAIIGKPFKGVHPDGSMGNLLDLTKKEKIYTSIVSYVKYLKDEYGVETVLFSLNESDLGIDVRQTAEEHNDLIKELGALFRAAGLQTEFLLGDTADANGWEFTTIASMDPESVPYIGGVSFHSWRGWTDENLIKWRDISNRVDAPLFVGEGSIDAGAWRYPQIFEEPTYALDEIDVYVKIMNIAQPRSILQWQLTADYSILSGGGISGNYEDELYPTQRFFNLKQLGTTPQGLHYIPITVDNKDVRAAALGDNLKGLYTIHLVNRGPAREVQLKGLPKQVKGVEMVITNQNSSNKRVKTIKVNKGKAQFILEGASFVSLFSIQEDN